LQKAHFSGAAGGVIPGAFMVFLFPQKKVDKNTKV
jgi:hypothetical protein